MDTLFRLIKALQKSEKRFFRLYAGRHVKGNNHSIELFDAIATQKQYDEKALKEKFRNSGIGRHFAFNKQYLYKLVLRALHHYDSHSSGEELIKEQIHYIRILFDRRLLEPCEKLIDKTVLLARKYETWHELVRLYEWKLEVISARLFRGYKEKEMLQLESEIKSALKNLSEYMNVYTAQRKLYFHAETRGILLAREEKEKYLVQAEEINKLEPHGFRTSIYKEHFIELVSRNLLGERGVPETNIKKILSLIQQYPHMMREAPREYLTAVYNYGIHKIYSRDHAGVQQMADKLRDFSSSTRLSPGLMYASLHFHAILQLGVYRNTLRYAEAEKYFEDFLKKEKKFEGMEPNISRQKVIYYVMSNLCFATENYKPCVRYLSKITTVRHSNERTDIDDYSRIMQMLAYFASGNTLSLEALAASVRKSFAKRKNLFRIEKLVFDFVTKNNKHLHDRSLMKEQYAALLSELRNIETNGSNEEKLALEYIDMVRWAELQIVK